MTPGLGGGSHACGLDLAEDVKDDDTADVQEADDHHGLGLQLPACAVLAEVSELVALAICAALASGQGRALVPLLSAVLCTLARAILGCHLVHCCFSGGVN